MWELACVSVSVPVCACICYQAYANESAYLHFGVIVTHLHNASDAGSNSSSRHSYCLWPLLPLPLLMPGPSVVWPPARTEATAAAAVGTAATAAQTLCCPLLFGGSLLGKRQQLHWPQGPTASHFQLLVLLCSAHWATDQPGIRSTNHIYVRGYGRRHSWLCFWQLQLACGLVALFVYLSQSIWAALPWYFTSFDSHILLERVAHCSVLWRRPRLLVTFVSD